MPYTVAGTTTHFIVQYDSSMAQGSFVAAFILIVCEAQYSDISVQFGGLVITTVPITVQIESTYGGASNNLTNFIDIRAGIDYKQAQYLLVAELAEIFMHAQGTWWNPANSKGEALSRLLGARAFFGVPGYQTGYFWLNAGRPNWVITTNPDDTSPSPIGCSIMFLYYMIYQLEYSLQLIIANTGVTLEAVYDSISGLVNGFIPFVNQLNTVFPQVQPVTFPDNPYPLAMPVPINTEFYLRRFINDIGPTPPDTGLVQKSESFLLNSINPIVNLAFVPNPAFVPLVSLLGNLLIPGIDYNILLNNVFFIGSYIANQQATVTYWH